MTSKQEKAIIVLITFVQLVNILDFMMVMPLGPDFSLALGVPLEKLGFIGGSYTMAAACSGILGAFFLDRFDRKTALAFSFLGLSIATLAGGFAVGFYSLMLTRVFAGIFAGPASSLALSIVADVIPVERRGKAMGFVMGAFPLASIFGVPAGLELARLGGWWFPFFFTGTLAVIISLLCFLLLPPMRAHLNAQSSYATQSNHFKHFTEWRYYLAFCTVGLAVFSTFLVVPNLSAYLQFNLGWPREHMGILYLLGGSLTLFSTRFGGIWVDRTGCLRPALLSTIVLCTVFLLGFIFPFAHYALPVPLIFTAFMMGNSLRFVSINTLNSKVPPPHLRARFMSTISAVQHIMSSIGAFVASHFLSTEIIRTVNGEKSRLVGMSFVALLSLMAAALIPFLIFQQRKNSCES